MIIILDRDGVINFDSPDYIKSPDEWIPIPGSLEAIAQLSQAGFIVVIATNQSGINRGLYTLEIMHNIHDKMISVVEKCGGKISGIYFCPHRPDENCECRKPKIGMLLQIQKDFKVKNTDMIFVGDSVKDYEAAEMFGCAFVLVKTGNGADNVKEVKNSPIFDNLSQAAKHFLKKC